MRSSRCSTRASRTSSPHTSGSATGRSTAPQGERGPLMADREVDFLLVGGFAAAHCATELRRRGAEGSIVLAGRETEPPYERPPLSKEYLRGKAQRADAYVHPHDWYEDNG